MAATLFRSRLRKRRTASSGAKVAIFIRFTANFEPGSDADFGPSAAEAVEPEPIIKIESILFVRSKLMGHRIFKIPRTSQLH